jgi:hypothetical protein
MKRTPFLFVVVLVVDAHVCSAIPPGFTGDYNEDGAVDEADYIDWRVNVGTINTLPNDPIGGTIGQPQYDQWAENFGNVAGGFSASGTPAMQVIKGGSEASGHLNASGNWVWKVQIAPSDPIPTGTTALNAAIGFEENGPNSQLLSASNLSSGSGDDFDTSNPSQVIFGWESLNPTANNHPVGLQVSTANDQVFSSLGSQVYTTTGFKDYISIETLGPCVDDDTPGSSCSTNDRLTTTIEWTGTYGAGGN